MNMDIHWFSFWFGLSIGVNMSFVGLFAYMEYMNRKTSGNPG